MGRLSRFVSTATRVGARVAAPPAFLLLVLFGFSHLFRPDLSDNAQRRYPPEAEAEARNLRRPTFPEQDPPRVQVPVAYARGERADWYPKGESPLLADLVERGRLPPVAERVGGEPMVLEGPEGIGAYGGTWLRSMPGASDLWVARNRMAGSTLVRWSPMGYPIVPALAKDWEINEDATEYTFHLRKGIRWSDGHPYTSADILYRFEKEIVQAGLFSDRFMRVNGRLGEVEAPDAHTVVFRFPEPNPLFLETLTVEHGIGNPVHYLSRYHPDDGDPEAIAEAMARYNQPNPRALYYHLLWVGNPERPSMAPWICRNEFLQPPYTFVRNPYYWAVDTQGNQLPYVDQVLYEVRDLRLLPIAAIGGGVHMQTRYVRFEDYTLLMEGREAGNYRLLHWYPATRSLWTLFPNLNRHVPEGDSEARMKHDLLRDKRFRQALSLAIERESIIEAEFGGVGEPAQLAPGRDSFFHHQGVLKAYTEFDLPRANRLLDELGLTHRDHEGYRTFPDGSRMTWIIDYTQFTGPGAVELVVGDWAAAGIRARAKERNRALYFLIKNGMQSDFLVWSGESEFHPLVQPRSFVPTSHTTFQAVGYGQWFLAGGLRGDPEADRFPAPPPGSDVEQAMRLLVEAMRQTTREGQREVFHRIFDLNAENVWSISIASPPPALVIVHNELRNVPEVALVGWNYATPANTGIETYFFRESRHPPRAEERIRSLIAGDFPPDPAAGGGEPEGERGGGGLSGKLVAGLLWGILLLAILLIALRHPFIARRILWAVPTLLVISVIAFTIIQLPPGNYLDTLIIQMQMSGDEAQEEQVDQLREMFHLDEPVYRQYLRWMGFDWFLGFKEEDRGLLQGDLGRSMQSQQSVNEEVGDRLVLTVAISAATILFTWLIALPIGIYSAVRQYSVGDYIFTLIGFIGLSVPNFLLALLLMFVSQEWFGVAATGLFSPEFAAQPGWSWPKFMDMLQHIWVPVVVLGTAGTAGMIRIMRANLLDELQKPYVTAARAKGVRPVKLLLKYPVRMALNPFVSGIGGILPTLISGGSIVAIVLSLPTVGPLLLQALLSEDMYLAGSMLMVLSSLTVLGVLVSDLLLLALDPRIRMEGASQ